MGSHFPFYFIIMKIGILLPQSKQYPSLDRDFMRGMKLNDLDVKFFIESIGIGADEKIIIEKMQKLSLQEDISIFIGFWDIATSKACMTTLQITIFFIGYGYGFNTSLCPAKETRRIYQFIWYCRKFLSFRRLFCITELQKHSHFILIL